MFVYGWIKIGFLSFILRYDAPTGDTPLIIRPLVDNKIGWIVMELPALMSAHC